MRIYRSLLLLLTASMSYGSTLDVYRDSSFYSYEPQNNHIGFAKGIRAQCKTDVLPVVQSSSCPEDDRLCRLHNSLKFLEEKKQATTANMKILEQLLMLPKPETLDGKALIETAKLTAEEQSRLLSLGQKLESDITIQENAFRKQAPSRAALQLGKSCEDEVELTIPNGISFSTRYEANIMDEVVEVTQYLSVINRSGVDIAADTANFYYRSAHQYLYPVHFSPWIARKYEPPVIEKRKMLKSSARMSEPVMEMAMADETMMAPAPVVTYEDTREYKVKNLTLPSSGEEVKYKLLGYKTDLKCELKAYPYENTQAFNVCTFEPQYQVESNSWKIREDSVLLNENATGEYDDENYALYTKIDEDIKIRRRPVVEKERESGIFGSTIRKKDGFSLYITNKSDKEKKLTLIERIPTSTTDEIEAKLLSVKSKESVDHKVLEDGKIEMHIRLEPNQSQKIEVMFELSYDKDLKVDY